MFWLLHLGFGLFYPHTAEEPWSMDTKLYQPYEAEQILLAENASCLAVKAYLNVNYAIWNQVFFAVFWLTQSSSFICSFFRCANCHTRLSHVQMLSICHPAVIWPSCPYCNVVHLSYPNWSRSSIWWKRKGHRWPNRWMRMNGTTSVPISV